MQLTLFLILSLWIVLLIFWIILDVKKVRDTFWIKVYLLNIGILETIILIGFQICEMR